MNKNLHNALTTRMRGVKNINLIANEYSSLLTSQTSLTQKKCLFFPICTCMFYVLLLTKIVLWIAWMNVIQDIQYWFKLPFISVDVAVLHDKIQCSLHLLMSSTTAWWHSSIFIFLKILTGRLLSGRKIANEADAEEVMEWFHQQGAKTVVLSSTDLGSDKDLLGLASSVMSR